MRWKVPPELLLLSTSKKMLVLKAKAGPAITTVIKKRPLYAWWRRYP
jgi:hypothetical protein